jgi:hypothetical protein
VGWGGRTVTRGTVKKGKERGEGKRRRKDEKYSGERGRYLRACSIENITGGNWILKDVG